jgi:hypothetical protein
MFAYDSSPSFAKARRNSASSINCFTNNTRRNTVVNPWTPDSLRKNSHIGSGPASGFDSDSSFRSLSSSSLQSFPSFSTNSERQITYYSWPFSTLPKTLSSFYDLNTTHFHISVDQYVRVRSSIFFTAIYCKNYILIKDEISIGERVIRKRYSQFYSLNQKLTSIGKTFESFPFPMKHLLINDQILKKRQGDFDRYCRFLYNYMINEEIVVNFFFNEEE